MEHAPSTEVPQLMEFTVQRVVEDKGTETRIVVLQQRQGSDVLPIWVGAAEGTAIQWAMDNVVTPRPMSHDLIRSFANHLNVTVQRVIITDVKSSTYYATIALASKGVERSVDARPSDAIALALRTQCPIYVAPDVLKRRGSNNLDAWLAKLEAKPIDTQEV